MSFVTYLAESKVREEKNTIEGKVFSRPKLIYTDGINVTYACDVDVGMEGVINENGDIGIIPLRNVPIAFNDRSLGYAEIDQPVTLTKDGSGRWEITGFAKTMPGTFHFVPVEIRKPCHSFPLLPGSQAEETTIIVGDGVEIGTTARVLGYSEIATFGSYGSTPYGAVGVFENGELSVIRSE